MGEDPGNRRIGHYEILRELGRGGMGAVYLANDPRTGRRVAVKVLLSHDEGLERFLAEGRAIARLRHPGIVAVHELSEDRGRPFLVMDVVDGSSLKERVARQGPLAPRDAAELILSLTEAVEYAHSQSIVHRDVKPANVLLKPDGSPVLTDFGIAKDLSSTKEHLTRTGQMLGTPAYTPPEQIDGIRHLVGPRSDVYGLGATLYTALTGRRPFEATTPMNVTLRVVTKPARPPSEAQPKVPADLDAIVLRCLAKHPDERYDSATALREDLQRFLAGEPVLSRGEASARSGTRIAGIVAGLLLVACAIGGALALNSGPANPIGPVDPIGPDPSQPVKPPPPPPPPPPPNTSAADGEDAFSRARAERNLQARVRSLRAWLKTYPEHALRDRVERRLGITLRKAPVAILTLTEAGKTHGWFTGPTTVVVVGKGSELKTFDVETGDATQTVQLPEEPKPTAYLFSAIVQGGIAISRGKHVLLAIGPETHTVSFQETIIHFGSSPDGERLAVALKRGGLVLVDVATREQHPISRGSDPEPVKCVCFLEDGRLWTFRGKQDEEGLGIDLGHAYLLDSEGLRTHRWSTHGLVRAAVQTAEDTLVLGNSIGAIRPVDFRGKKLEALKSTGQELTTGHRGAIRGLALSADRSLLYSVGAGTNEREQNELISWDLKTRTMLRRLTRPYVPETVAISPDDRYLAVGTKSGFVEVWAAEAFAKEP